MKKIKLQMSGEKDEMLLLKGQSLAMATGRRWMLSSDDLHKTDSEAHEAIMGRHTIT